MEEVPDDIANVEDFRKAIDDLGISSQLGLISKATTIQNCFGQRFDLGESGCYIIFDPYQLTSSSSATTDIVVRSPIRPSRISTSRPYA